MKQHPRSAILFILVAAIANNATPASAFIGIQGKTNPFRPSFVASQYGHPLNKAPPTASTTTSLEMAGGGGLFASASEAVAPLLTPIVRRMLLVLGAAYLVLTKRLNKILYPGSGSDPTSDAPLQPGSFGCPFLGSNIMAGSTEYGPTVFFNNARKKLGNPSIFKSFAFGLPMVSVSGKETSRVSLRTSSVPRGSTR